MNIIIKIKVLVRENSKRNAHKITKRIDEIIIFIEFVLAANF